MASSMSKVCSTSPSLLPVGVLLLAILLCSIASVSLGMSFEELLSVAERLESSEYLGSTLGEKQRKQQENLLYSFTRETKNEQCRHYLDQAKDKINQFHVKAVLLKEESKRGNKNWFGGAFGPLGALRGLAKFNPALGELVERYQSRASELTEEVIKCDLTKVLRSVLNNILFVYKTDLKTLVTGERELVNGAILDQLKRDNLVSKVNFYEFEKPTERQQHALLEYLSSIHDPNSILIGDALNQYLSPGQFILGRTMDTCTSVLTYNEIWLKVTENAHCSGSSVSSSQLSKSIDSSDKYEQMASFCNEMLNLSNDQS